MATKQEGSSQPTDKQRSLSLSNFSRNLKDSWIGRNWQTVLLLAMMVFLALFVRSYFGYSTSVDNGYLVSGGSDSYYHMRVIDHAVATGDHLVYDDMLNYPNGMRNPRPPGQGPPADAGTLLEQAPDGIIVLDQELRILHANARACEMFGLSLDEMRRTSVEDLSAPDDLRMHPLRRERIQTGCATITYRQLRRRDGTVFTVEASGRSLADGRIVAVLRDITSRPGAEQRLAESKRNLARAQELARFGTWEVDLGTYTARWSRELYRIFGLPPDQGPIVFGRFTARLHPEDRAEVERLVGEAIAGRLPPQTFEFRIVRPDGSVRILHGTMDARREPDGRVSRLMGSAQDITERRLLELQLRQAQKMEAIGRLAGGVAHDFNNLLTVILGFVETMLDGMSPDDGHRAGAEQIRLAARRAAGLTQQLLAFGRRQMLRPEVFDLNAVLTEMQEILRRLIGERVEVTVCTGARHALIRADRGQIEQVVFNLALNARDAMPSGGRLEIATSDVDGPAGDGGAVGPPAPPCLLLAVSVGAANLQDRDAGLPAVARAAEKYPEVAALFVDSAYAGACAQRIEHDHGIRVEVVRHPGNRTVGRWIDAAQPDLFEIRANADGFVPLPKRWVVERTHAWNERARRLIMHHDVRTDVSETWVWLTEARILLRRLTTEVAEA